MRKFLFFLAMLLFVGSAAFAQERTVSGKVVDEKGNVVPNASILVKGTKLGTATDASGGFSISVPASAKTLVVSATGHTTQEVSLTSSSEYSVNLPTISKSLEEVLVVGYGTQSRINVTGAVSTVKSTQIENKPFTSVDKALQGNVTGLQATSTSGAPGASTDIRIRGLGSLNASNSPLWVIDGVIATTGDLTSNTTSANILSTLKPR